jgi:hypothetical protein
MQNKPECLCGAIRQTTYSGKLVLRDVCWHLTPRNEVSLSRLNVMPSMKRLLLFVFFLLLQENLSARLPDLIPYRKGDLWGYCDSTKKIIIEPEYERVEFFSGNTAVVRKHGKDGIIDKSGIAIVKFSFHGISSQAHGGNRLYQSDDGENDALMNENGENIDSTY